MKTISDGNSDRASFILVNSISIILLMAIGFGLSRPTLAADSSDDEIAQSEAEKSEAVKSEAPKASRRKGEMKKRPVKPLDDQGSKDSSQNQASSPEQQSPPLSEEADDEPGSLHELFKSLDYPELQVVPRASQRLKMESGEEGDNWWYIHWPMYVSALATAGFGSTASQSLRDDLNETEENDAKSAVLAARTVGVSWFLGTMLLASRKPYQKGNKRVRGISGSGRSNDLMRERLSEEALEKTAHQFKVLSYVSVFTNVAVAGYAGSFLTDRGRVTAAVTGMLSFLPIIFDDWYVYNYKKHLEYKRNIFAPVVSMGVREDSVGSREAYPMLSWVVEY